MSKGRLLERWVCESRDETLSEFVAGERQACRERRRIVRSPQSMLPASVLRGMQNSPPNVYVSLQAGLQGIDLTNRPGEMIRLNTHNRHEIINELIARGIMQAPGSRGN